MSYPDAEYIGHTKMTYKINEPNFPWYRSETQFWRWFKDYENFLFNFDKNQSLIQKCISRKLQIIVPDLTFEIGPVIDGRREFKIFGPEYILERVAKKVPELKFWRITFLNSSATIQK